MATRPRSERISGSHGLFSQSDKEIDLATASKDVSAFNGNIFTVIISVSRNDAERLGFNNANRWRDMIRAKISDVAKAHDIPLEDLEWYGAFHNESHHPHVHLLLYSRNENYPGFKNAKILMISDGHSQKRFSPMICTTFMTNKTNAGTLSAARVLTSSMSFVLRSSRGSARMKNSLRWSESFLNGLRLSKAKSNMVIFQSQ